MTVVWNFWSTASIANMQFLFLFISLVVLVGCAQKTDNIPLGGYNYPDIQSRIDTNDYSHPIRDMISTRDSFNVAYYERFFHHSLNEPNLSIKPLGQTRFRLTYRSAFGDAAVVNIFPNRIVAKQLIEGSSYPEYDSTRLTPLERRFYNILELNFPLQEKIKAGRKSLHSLSKLHPQLLDPHYYKELLDKCRVANTKGVTYVTKEFPISQKKYLGLVKHIKSIGYWSMPYEIICNDSSTDGFGVTLEANTETKYNIVLRVACTKEEIPFLKVCQEIINLVNFQYPVHIFTGE